MEKQNKALSIKIIYWVTNISFWLFVASFGAAVIFSILLLFGLNSDVQLHVGIPVGQDILEQGRLALNNTIVNVEFVEMYGKLHFIDTPLFIGRLYAIFILSIMGAFLFIFHTFRRFINNIYRGDYFDLFNISLLKRIAYTLMGIWAFSVFYAYFQYYYLIKNIEFENIKPSGDIDTSPFYLVVALFIWVLSHVFMKGCELQEENNYTI
jgi:Protein of unknown function (DUF2975)